MPGALQEIKVKYVTHYRAGHGEKFPDRNALMEEVNKEPKSWLKLSGIPNE